MKRLITIILVIALILPAAASAEFLTETEKQYVGSWVMYATHNEKTYLFTITFFDDSTVVSLTTVFVNNQVYSNNKSSGLWLCMSGTLMFTLAGHEMTGHIDEDGILYIYEKGGKNASGVYTKCPDLSYKIQ